MKNMLRSMHLNLSLEILLVFLLAAAGVFLWTEWEQVKTGKEPTGEELTLLGEVLESVFGVVNPENGEHPIADFLGRLSTIPRLKRLRIFDVHGVVHWSTDETEKGRHLEKEIYRNFLLGRSSYRLAGGQQGLIKQVNLHSSCLRCHQSGAAGELIGGLQLELSPPSTLKKGTGRLWVKTAIFLMLALILGLALVLLLRHKISLPLDSIRRGLEDALVGKYASAQRENDRDEMGRLGKAVNRLMRKLADLESAQIDSQLVQKQAERELALKEELEQKNRIIQDTNQSLTRRVQELELLYGLSADLVGTLDSREICRIVSSRIGQAMPVEGFLMLMVDQQKLRISAISGVFEKFPAEKLTDAQFGLCTEALRRRRLVYHPDISKVRGPLGSYDNLGLTGSLVGVPLIQRNFNFGVLVFYRQRTEAFSEDELRLLESLARQASLALATSHLYQEKLDLSVTDDLTQVANRRQLFVRLEQEWNRARRFGGPLSVLMIDVDHFKNYNDRNGHLLGDKVLKEVANVLKSNTRNVDVVARYGGEEFVIILPGQSKEAAVSVAEKLRTSIAERSFPKGYSQPLGKITISVGVATFPDDAENPQQLLEKADLALYASKREGRNRTTAFHPQLAAMDQERLHQQQVRHRPRRRRQVLLVDPT